MHRCLVGKREKKRRKEDTSAILNRFYYTFGHIRHTYDEQFDEPVTAAVVVVVCGYRRRCRFSSYSFSPCFLPLSPESEVDSLS